MKGTIDVAKHCANVLKVLCQPSRVKIIGFVRAGEKSVMDITEGTGFSQPNVSQYILKMHLLGILESRREGKMTLYRTNHRDAALSLIDTAMKRPLLVDPLPISGPDGKRRASDLAIYKLLGGSMGSGLDNLMSRVVIGGRPFFGGVPGCAHLAFRYAGRHMSSLKHLALKVMPTQSSCHC